MFSAKSQQKFKKQDESVKHECPSGNKTAVFGINMIKVTDNVIDLGVIIRGFIS